jgi:hypothetical protein
MTSVGAIRCMLHNCNTPAPGENPRGAQERPSTRRGPGVANQGAWRGERRGSSLDKSFFVGRHTVQSPLSVRRATAPLAPLGPPPPTYLRTHRPEGAQGDPRGLRGAGCHGQPLLGTGQQAGNPIQIRLQTQDFDWQPTYGIALLCVRCNRSNRRATGPQMNSAVIRRSPRRRGRAGAAEW